MESQRDILAREDVLELFNANYRTALTALGGDRSRDRHNDMRSIEAKAKKQAAEQTRKQVGDDAWQRFTGSSGRGWRRTPANVV